MPTLADIFSDVDRFAFPTRVHHIANDNLEKLINENIIATDTLKEKVIAVYSVRRSDICTAPLPQVRGARVSVAGLVITNFGLLAALTGDTTYRAGNTQYSQSYWGAVRCVFTAIDQIEIVATRTSSDFEVRFYGPDTPLTGTTFVVKGAVGPILWIANLYGIRVDLILGIVPNPKVYATFAVVSAILGVVAGTAGGLFKPELFLYVVPVLALSGAAWWENWRSAVYSKLYALSARAAAKPV
jgi:hypothetical protein